MKLKKKIQAMRRIQAMSMVMIMVLSLVLGNLVLKTVKDVYAAEIEFTKAFVDSYVYAEHATNAAYNGNYGVYIYTDQNGNPSYCLASGLGSAAGVTPDQIYSQRDRNILNSVYGSDMTYRIENILRNGYPLNRDYWTARGISEEAQQYATASALHAVMEAYDVYGNSSNDPIIQQLGKRNWAIAYENDYTMYNNTDMDVVGMIKKLVECGEYTNTRLYGASVTVTSNGYARESTGFVGSWSVDASDVKGSITLSFTTLPEGSGIYLNDGTNEWQVPLTNNTYAYDVNGNSNLIVKLRSPYSSVTSDYGINLKAEAKDYRYYDDAESGNVHFYMNSDDSIQDMAVIQAAVKVQTGAQSIANLAFPATSLNISIVKSDANNGAVLAGAVYGVYSDAECNTSVGTITTDSEGKGSLKNLTWGTYYLKETKAPEGYELDETVYTIYSDSTVAVSSVNKDVKDTPKIKINVIKSDKYTSETLSGAVYGIYSDEACSNLVGTLPETDTNGSATSDYLSQGIYYLKEITAPANYDLSDEVITLNTTVNSSMTTYRFDSNVKDVAKGQVEIVKKDENTQTPLAGAVYGLYSDEACTQLLETLPSTDSNGKAQSTGWYSEGTYYLKEITAPNGYDLSTKVYDFNMGGITKLAHVMVTDVAKGKLVVYKVDASTNILLSGAVYGLYSDLQCTKLVETLPATDTDGKTESSLHTKGNYYIKEIKAPEHYTIDDTVYPIMLGGENVLVEKILSDKHKGQVEITKVDYKDATKKLSGAIYGIYSDSECQTLISTMPETDENGYSISEELEYGDYFIKEIKAPEKYDLDKTVYPVTVGDDKIVVPVTVKDKPQGHIKVVKTEESDKNEFVEGAVYGVYTTSDCKEADLVLKLEATNEKGIATSDCLEVGTYYVKEITAPEGFVLSTKVYKANVESDTETVVETSNKAQVGYIKVYKYGERLVSYNNGTFTWEKGYVAGAEFTIYDKDGKVVDTIVTTTDGPTQSDALRLGTYTVKETKAPNGHIIDEEGHEITLSLDNTTEEYTTKDYENVNTRQQLDLIINKVNEKTNKPISNVEFALYADENICDYNGNILINKGEMIAVVTTDENGYAEFKTDLPHCKYMLYETKTPSAYVPLSEGIEIDYTDTFGYNETYSDTKTIANTPIYGEDEDESWKKGNGSGDVGADTDVPNTGDRTDIKIVVFMMFLSLLAMIAAGLNILREKNNIFKNRTATLGCKKNL